MIKARFAWKNPVVAKEIRTRMRGNRAFLLFSAHLLILSLGVMLAYIFFHSTLSTSNSPGGRQIAGKAIFGLLLLMELVTVSFVSPALTSGMISAERERQTYDLLKITLLPASSLVLGKYISGLVFIFLLLFTSIPLSGPAFIAGGILLQEILIGILILIVTAIAFCAFGMFCSCVISRTMVSTALSYGFSIILVFGLPAIYVIVLLLLSNSTQSLDQIPIGSQIRLYILGWVLFCLTPLSTILVTEISLIDQNNIFLIHLPVNDSLELTLLSPWIVYVALYLTLSVVLLWASIRRVKKVDL